MLPRIELDFSGGRSCGCLLNTEFAAPPQEPSPYEMALFREIGDSSFKGSTSLPSIDTDDFHFLKFYDTKASREARERARQAVEGIRDFVPSPKAGFPPFPGPSLDP